MRSLSNRLLEQLNARESNDPFLMLLTISGDSINTVRLVNNTENITSRSNVYMAFPMKITLPIDDGETTPSVNVVFDNVSLELIEEIRTVTKPLDVKIEAVLASSPDYVEISYSQLKMKNIRYTDKLINASLYFEDILNTGIPSEKYEPNSYPGIF